MIRRDFLRASIAGGLGMIFVPKLIKSIYPKKILTCTCWTHLYMGNEQRITRLDCPIHKERIRGRHFDFIILDDLTNAQLILPRMHYKIFIHTSNL